MPSSGSPAPALMTSACPGNAPPRPGGSPPPGSAGGLATSARRSLVQPVRRNPASPSPAARQGRRTAAPHPPTTTGKPPEGNSPSPHDANAQVKRQGTGRVPQGRQRRGRIQRLLRWHAFHDHEQRADLARSASY